MISTCLTCGFNSLSGTWLIQTQGWEAWLRAAGIKFQFPKRDMVDTDSQFFSSRHRI